MAKGLDEQVFENNFIEDPYGFIYITTNLVNGKRYIGQKKFDSASRWHSYLGSGYHLTNAIKTYGRENFTRDIVDIGFTEKELNEKEKAWIANYNAVESDNYYNMVDGGKVQESLAKRGSVPLICIDNELVFKSVVDASEWCGYTTTAIRNSFGKKHIFNNEEEKLIFRPLSTIKRKHYLCRVCGENYIKKSNSQKLCEYCSEMKKDYKCKLIIDPIHKKKTAKNIMISSISDSWVQKWISDNYLESRGVEVKERFVPVG